MNFKFLDSKSIFFFLLLGLAQITIPSCGSCTTKENKITNNLKDSIIKEITIKKDTSFLVEKIAVDIQIPKGKIKGTILMLPGWNFSRMDCCEKSKFCQKAKAQGFLLVMPEMGKSVYAPQIYPETRVDWKKYPTRTWLIDTLIPFLQKQFNVLLKGDNNFIYGISTGARGVALIALHSKDIFQAGAALSGDYDQTQMPNDNLMKGYYGTCEKFKKRWEGDENPLLSASKITIPLFLGHGEKDAVVPNIQSKQFYKKLKEINPKTKSVLIIGSKAGHNYAFWDSQTEAVLKYFASYSVKK
ncbi:MAG: prolyl oligopeptidase family serine peptidase [Bacteroidetes bacterium]|nr:prolyl oligopeptidase family serine peptidase [Bacteroidota bacterium]